MTTSKLLEDLPCIRSQYSNDIPFEELTKILLINPNTTQSFTTNCLKMIGKHLPVDTMVYGFTAPEPSPSTIEGHLDGVLSAAVSIKAAYSYIEEADAVLVACFSDHPLTNCIREEFDKPTCGILEAGVYSARMLGGRFGIIATLYRSQIRHKDAINALGLGNHCAGLLSTGYTVSELETKPRADVLKRMSVVAVSLVKDMDADCIVLGCAGMSDMQIAVEEAVSKYNVQVIDGVVAGINLLSGLVRCDLKTSKRGLFTSSKSSRTLRGQDYL